MPDGAITYTEVAQRLGVSEATVRTLLRHGVLEQTLPPADGSRRVKARASIDPDPLDRARVWLEQRKAARAEAKRRREQHGKPPDYDHVWLDTATVAAMGGLTVQWAQWMAREGKMPATFHGASTGSDVSTLRWSWRHGRSHSGQTEEAPTTSLRHTGSAGG